MLRGVARKLYESLKSGQVREPDWFDAALTIAMTRRVGLDQVIWEAVREILDEVERESRGEDRSDPPPFAIDEG